jgi:fructose-bisphosphate aldolase, class I
MATKTLQETARALVAPGKGILAADESHATIGRRFEPLGIANSEENRRHYRQMLLTTKGIGEFISGVILFDETIRQATDDGRPFVDVLGHEGIIPGIKVDRGAKLLTGGAPGEQVTEGLDGLRERLAEYKKLGARFAKWRAVIAIGDDARTPTRLALEANAAALARYAALCQEAEIVPIVEPEVLMDGGHTIERCFEVTEATLHTVFHAIWEHQVVLEEMLLKPSMVLPGAASARPASVEAVAEATVRCLRRTVPAAVPGIVFLSGGQSDERATAHLNAMNRLPGPAPWPLSFSFARALQAAPLARWGGDAMRVDEGQRAFRHRARCNSAARAGAYTAELERSVA